MKSQYIDISVSRQKFDFELNQFLNFKESNRKRGIILLDASFPNIYLVFSAIRLNPSPIIFAVKINYDNYDLEPLSIAFVNPFTFELIKSMDQLATHFRRKISREDGSFEMQVLLVQNNGKLPFICIPGVREYHNHPAHTGDPWLIHRDSGEGTLGFIVDKLYEYGVSSIDGYQVQLSYKIPIMQLSLDLNRLPE